ERRGRDFGGCRCQAAALAGDPAATDPVCSKSPHRGRVDAMIADADADAPLIHRTSPDAP
ncbi:MAG: pyrroloquinoline quinone biosynthesis protein PqqE, partial [Paracoccaceae bacterium]